MPLDVDLYTRSLPVTKKLLPGMTLEQVIDLPVPLVETSVYFRNPPEEGYKAGAAKTLRIALDYVETTVPGFTIRNVESFPDFYSVRSRGLVADSKRIACDFPLTEPLAVQRRLDNYPRVAD